MIEQKLKEFRKHIFNKTFSRDGKIYWDEVESFLRKALELQERKIRKQMNIVLADKCDEMDRMAKRLNKEIKEWQDDYIAMEKDHEQHVIKARIEELERLKPTHNKGDFGNIALLERIDNRIAQLKKAIC